MTLLKYEHIEIKECGDPLIDLSTYGFFYEPVYYDLGFSSDPKPYIRKTIAEKLLTIQKKLNGLRFKIFDGWRSREVQHQIYMSYWNHLKTKHSDWDDEKLKNEVGAFVSVGADPNRTPVHSTGGAVDLTLTMNTGEELDMGTGFDHFGPESASLYFENNGSNAEAKENRRILRQAMIEEEFRIDRDEWWHFDYGNQLWAAHYGKPYAIYGEISF